ncbi:MAG: hypothetical protein ACR2OO_00800 [Thermomicrobiales bacterium]
MRHAAPHISVRSMIPRAAAVAAIAEFAAAAALSGPLPSARAAAICAASSTPSAATTTTTTPAAAPADASPDAAAPTQAPIQAEVIPPGDIPDSQAFVTYRSAAGGYSVAMPEGWARTESGANASFSDKLHGFSVAIECAAATPTVESVTANEIAKLGQTEGAFELVGVRAVTLPAGPAILIQYRADSQPDEVTGRQHRLDADRYEIWKDGTLAIVTLAVPSGSDNVDVSKKVSESFAWTP